MSSQVVVHPEAAGSITADGRCVVVVDEELPAGRVANASAVLALTLGAAVAGLPGAALIDADGDPHPGLIPRGVTVLKAPIDVLCGLRRRAVERDDLLVVDFPTDGQETNDYDEFRRRVADTRTEQLRYLAVLLYGPRRRVAQLTGSLPLFR